MKKKYESFVTVDIELYELTDDKNYVVIIDITNNAVICRKHINYIKKIGLELKVPYMVKLGVYTNERGFIDADILYGKIWSYNQVQADKSAPVKKSSPQAPKPSKTVTNKPAWLK